MSTRSVDREIEFLARRNVSTCMTELRLLAFVTYATVEPSPLHPASAEHGTGPAKAVAMRRTTEMIVVNMVRNPEVAISIKESRSKDPF